MKIKEFSKRRMWEKASLGDERTKILHKGIKMKKEEDEISSQEIRSRKRAIQELG